MLTIKHLTKQFGRKRFSGISASRWKARRCCGTQRWGKTTLLRILMGLEEPTSGIVQGVGRVAAVFQEDRLCPQLTAVQNVTLVLPGSAEQYKEQIIKDFQQFGMDAAALACLPHGFPADRSAARLCCGLCGPPAIRCC